MTAFDPPLPVVRRLVEIAESGREPNMLRRIAWGLENAQDWFRQMPRDLERSRDRLDKGKAETALAFVFRQAPFEHVQNDARLSGGRRWPVGGALLEASGGTLRRR